MIYSHHSLVKKVDTANAEMIKMLKNDQFIDHAKRIVGIWKSQYKSRNVIVGI